MRQEDESLHPKAAARKKAALSRQAAVWAFIGVAVYKLTLGGESTPGAEQAIYAAALLVIGGVATWADLREIFK